jgi:ankyrin repeat protein
MLLDQGADINLGDFHGWTALYLAAMHGASDDLIQLLLEVSPDTVYIAAISGILS